MIGDVLVPTGPNYGPWKSGAPYGAAIHDLEAPRNFNVRNFMGPGTYPDNQGVSPHTMSDTRIIGQILDEDRWGAHLGRVGNPLLVAFEVVGYAKWTKAEWMEDIRPLLNQARAVANLWRSRGWKASDLKWGSLAELKEAKRRYDAGLPCVAPRLWTHNDVSEALGGTNHWDPGKGFPFAEFTRWCLEYLVGKGADSTGTTPNIPDAPTTGGAQADWFDNMDAAELRQIIGEEVAKVLRSEGVSGAADLGRSKDMTVSAVAEVLRSEGVSGAGDVGRIAEAVAARLGK